MDEVSVKPKILFVYEHQKPEWWMDGLWAALNILDKDFEIERYNLKDERPLRVNDRYYDFALGWGGFRSRVDHHLQNGLQNIGKHKGLCIAGNAFPPDGANRYDVLFYETKWYRPQIDFHKNIVQAFGINSDIFSTVDIPMPIVWDYIGVGALADWKRWEFMTGKKGIRMVVGEYQQNNEDESARIARRLLQGGVAVSPMVNPFDLANFYHWSRTLFIPSNIYGGGERAVLEARACGLPIEIAEDNDKLKELLTCDIPSHEDYAVKLKQGILSCIS